MKVKQLHVLDWQDELGRTPVLHALIRKIQQEGELGQDTYVGIDRDCLDEEDSTRLAILDEVEKLTGDRLDKLLITIWW